MREARRNSLIGGMVGLIIGEIAYAIGRSKGLEVDINTRIGVCLLLYGCGSAVGGGISFLREEIRERGGKPLHLNIGDYFVVCSSLPPLGVGLYLLR